MNEIELADKIHHINRSIEDLLKPYKNKDASFRIKAERTLALVGLIYNLVLATPVLKSWYHSQEIPQEAISQTVQTERDKLGIDKDVKIDIKRIPFLAAGRKTGEKEYTLYLPKGKKVGSDDMRHELTHIALGHADDHFKTRNPLMKAWKYFTKYEPEAVGYTSID